MDLKTPPLRCSRGGNQASPCGRAHQADLAPGDESREQQAEQQQHPLRRLRVRCDRESELARRRDDVSRDPRGKATRSRPAGAGVVPSLRSRKTAERRAAITRCARAALHARASRFRPPRYVNLSLCSATRDKRKLRHAVSYLQGDSAHVLLQKLRRRDEGPLHLVAATG